MKTIHIAALAVVLTLAACGGEPDQGAVESHDEAGAGHDEEGHAEGEAGHGEEGDEHEEAAPSTVIPAAVAEQSSIEVQPARDGVIADEHEVQGLLTPIEGRVAEVGARFPGVVRSVRANVGDSVAAGQTLATIHSNLSLSTYTVAAPI